MAKGTFKVNILIGILAVAVCLSCSPRVYAEPAESIVIAPSSAIGITTYVNIAQEQHFFVRNGLKVTVRHSYIEGLDALNGLLKGDVDIAGASEYPIAGKAFNNDNVCIVANLNKGGTFFLVARKDRGTKNIATLKGKRIGVTLRTINEFYLGRFLNLHGLQIGDVSRVNFPLVKLGDVLTGGGVDAVMTREPYLGRVRKELGPNDISWPTQSHQPTYGLLAARNDWIRQHPDLLKRLLKSLSQAEEYIVKHPAEAKAVTQKQFNFSEETVENIWTGFQFSLSLDQSLILAMEDEARWMINNRLTTKRQVPNFLNYIYEDGLKELKPTAVNIIR